MDWNQRAHGTYVEAQNKFDYFVLGLITAVCAYLAQSIHFAPLGLNVASTFLLSFLCFGLAAIFGFKRVEWMVVAYRANHEYLEAQEKNNIERVGLVWKEMERIAIKVAHFYKVRNIFFFLGFVFYIAAKFLGAYGIS